MSNCILVEPKHNSTDVTINRQLITNQLRNCFTTTMTRGQAVSEPIQWTIIRLSAIMPPDEISGYTDISVRKVYDILAHFKKTGGINVSKREQPTLHVSLQDEDIQV